MMLFISRSAALFVFLAAAAGARIVAADFLALMTGLLRGRAIPPPTNCNAAISLSFLRSILRVRSSSEVRAARRCSVLNRGHYFGMLFFFLFILVFRERQNRPRAHHRVPRLRHLQEKM